jgi:GWxTD domain-containing protein
MNLSILLLDLLNINEVIEAIKMKSNKKFYSWTDRCFVGYMQKLLLLGFIVIFSKSLLAQDKQINFFVDHAQYRLQDDYVYLEVYYSISRQSFTFVQAENGLQATGIIKTYVSQNDKKILLDSLIINDFIKSKNDVTPSQRFADVSMIQIKQGNYLLNSSFLDLNSGQTATQYDSLYLKPYNKNVLALSDIELANSIVPQPERVNKFDKNGLRVLPNASKIYGTGLDKLSFYAEAYNLSFDDVAKASPYHLIYYILDQQGKTYKEYKGHAQKKPGTSCIIHGAMDVSDLPSGFYIFKIIVTDEYTGQIAESSKLFNVYKIEDFIASNVEKSKNIDKDAANEFDLMNEDELNEYFGPIRYLCSKDEAKIFTKLDINGKRNFLKSFWKLRDPDPSTAVNEKKIQFSQLIEYANSNFSMSSKPGWKSDRGRILLIYGKPDEIERNPLGPHYKEHEIWRYYNVEGGVEFVFVDIRSVRDLELVHSTHSKEIHDEDWEDRYLKY